MLRSIAGGLASLAILLGGLFGCSNVYDATALRTSPSGEDGRVSPLGDARVPSDAAPPDAAMDAKVEMDGRTADSSTDAQTEDAASDAQVPDAGMVSPPSFVSLDFTCKLINDADLDDPTANDTHHHANLRGAALGIPVTHGSNLFLFFGDAAGYKGIWAYGPESLPDAIGYSTASSASVAADPTLLCSTLRFVPPGTSVGPGQDATIESDFAGAWMTPPGSDTIDMYIKNPAGPRGTNSFPDVPGDAEVPSGAFSHGGSIYLFYTTVVSPDTVSMTASYLARWTAPSTTDALASYEILYALDQRVDDNGPLGGDFIQVAPLVVGNYLYLFGTGDFRASPVHLARKPIADLETEGGFERFDAATRTWIAGDAAGDPIVDAPYIGELSVRYFPEIERYVMLDQEASAGYRIVARFAELPEGPWSDPVTIANMGNAAFLAKYCCLSTTSCGTEELFHCETASFYAPYMLPSIAVNGDESFTISFLMSTEDPYNVALMSATFE